MTDLSEWDRGFKACQCGEPSSANPHPAGTPEYNTWLAGWTDLYEHYKARDAAFAATFGGSW
jgi:hypothetical protein